MKIIDLLNMISKGEEVPKKIRYQANSHKMDLYTYNEYTGDYQREIGIDLFTYLFSKERILGFLNDEVEIIEEDKKIEKYNTGLDNGNWNEESVKKGILENNNIEDYLIRVMKDVDNIKFKTFEIIDYLNKENK